MQFRNRPLKPVSSDALSVMVPAMRVIEDSRSRPASVNFRLTNATQTLPVLDGYNSAVSKRFGISPDEACVLIRNNVKSVETWIRNLS